MIAPLIIVMEPRVAMKGGILPSKIMKPLIMPNMTDAIRARDTAIQISMPFFISKATKMPAKPTTDPTDRSIPPAMMTKVIPSATIPLIDVCRTRLDRLFPVMKPLVAIVRKTTITRRMSTSVPSVLSFSGLFVFMPFAAAALAFILPH